MRSSPEWKLPSERSELAFPDGKPAYNQAQAVAEASRCLYCHNPPCVQACPTHIDIPTFIRKIATGNVKGSARTIFDANILGYSCARACPVEELCVGDCVYNDAGIPPIQIGRLQRYSTEIAVREGWSYFTAGAPTGKSVGLVGAGPASLACAHELRRLGHACTLYEKSQVPGGLDVTGIAPYKLRGDEALQEIHWVCRIGGIDVQAGVEVGKDIAWEELERRHDAVFVGMGLGPDRRLPGADLDGVDGAVAWIEKMKLGSVSLAGVRSAVVLGGGNTAMDCLRELAGLGVPEVTMVYRGTPEGMSGYKHEWEAAKKLGVRGIFGATPAGFVGEGRVSGVRFKTAEGEQEIPAQLVLLAIGQARLGEQLRPLGIQADTSGRLIADAHGALSRPRWYAGGDCTNGGMEVVNAVAEGKAAALSIHRAMGV
jgi:dihydropyrimidine dehydrogenase (NAD+) subunit PreT